MADFPPGHPTARSLILWHLPAASPGQGDTVAPRVPSQLPFCQAPSWASRGAVGSICRRPSSLVLGLGLLGLRWKDCPWPRRVTSGPVSRHPLSFPLTVVSTACLASLLEASAQFPEFTWLACPECLALPEQSGTRTYAPPHVSSGLQAGEPLSCPGADQGGEAGLPRWR